MATMPGRKRLPSYGRLQQVAREATAGFTIPAATFLAGLALGIALREESLELADEIRVAIESADIWPDEAEVADMTREIQTALRDDGPQPAPF